MKPVLIALLGLFCACSLLAGETPYERAPAEHKKLFDAAREELLKDSEQPLKPLASMDERWFWFAAAKLEPLLDAYAYSRETVFLDRFVATMEQALKERYVHPTEPETWSGWFHYKTQDHSYMVIHAGIAHYKPALTFALLVRADPALNDKYGAKAEAWFKEIHETDIRAWDRRGCWKDFGEKGGWYVKITQKPDAATHQLVPEDDRLAGTSYAYNKAHRMIEGLVLAYRLTGDAWYKERIEKCERYFRSKWRVDEKHAEWNYRDRTGVWDYNEGIEDEAHAKFGEWVHPKGGYFATDVDAAVACYDAGLAFTRADMEKLIQSNLEFMWDGNEKKPEFSNINGKVNPQGKMTGHGSLWTALARFSEKTRTLWRAELDAMRPGKFGWTKNVMAYLLAVSEPVSWEPRHVKEIPALASK
ncbi:MAG: hypothetical protein M5U26_05435 [Planctomycetota bacterium]|nr:hypothetical protein [Planctomycetota bacterium]